MQMGTWKDGLRVIVAIFGKFLIMFLGLAGALGGYFLGEAVFPRNDTASLVCAAVGIVPGAVLGYLIVRFLSRLVA